VDKGVVLSERDARLVRQRVGESKADADRLTVLP
jgi:hypothetical protein